MLLSVHRVAATASRSSATSMAASSRPSRRTAQPTRGRQVCGFRVRNQCTATCQPQSMQTARCHRVVGVRHSRIHCSCSRDMWNNPVCRWASNTELCECAGLASPVQPQAAPKGPANFSYHEGDGWKIGLDEAAESDGALACYMHWQQWHRKLVRIYVEVLRWPHPFYHACCRHILRSHRQRQLEHCAHPEGASGLCSGKVILLEVLQNIAASCVEALSMSKLRDKRG